MAGSVAKAELIGGSNTAALPPLKPLLIGIAGGTASGKTSVCKAIIDALKGSITEHQTILSISQDCFYKDLPPDFTGGPQDYNFDSPLAFDFEQIRSVLRRLHKGQPVALPQYSFVTSSRCADVTHVERANVILFDGILAFYDPEVREQFDVKVFVDADADTRLIRRIKRDMIARGRDITQVLDQYERTVKPSFENFIFPTLKHADIIVPRGIENRVAIDIVVQHVKYKLRKQAAAEATSVVNDTESTRTPSRASTFS